MEIFIIFLLIAYGCFLNYNIQKISNDLKKVKNLLKILNNRNKPTKII